MKCAFVPTFEPEQPVVVTCQEQAEPDPTVLALETPAGIKRFVVMLCVFHKVAIKFENSGGLDI